MAMQVRPVVQALEVNIHAQLAVGVNPNNVDINGIFLANYNSEGYSIDAPVQSFANNYFETEVFPKAIGEGGTKGLSGAIVYRIFDSPHFLNVQLLAVVKAFNRFSEFVQEIEAVSTLAGLVQQGRLQHSHHVLICDVARCDSFRHGVQQTHWLVLQTAAKGYGIDDWIKFFLIGKVEATVLQRIFNTTGKALGELHLNTISNQAALIGRYVDQLCGTPQRPGMFDEVITFEGWRGHHIIQSLAGKREQLDRLIQNLQADQNSGTIIHGDSHPGNLFAHVEDNDGCRVTFIDTPSLTLSISDFNNLRGSSPCARDYSNFIVRSYDIQKSEVNDEYQNFKQVINFFRQAYIHNQFKPSKHHRVLQKIRSHLGTACKFIDNVNAYRLVEGAGPYNTERAVALGSVEAVCSVLDRYV